MTPGDAYWPRARRLTFILLVFWLAITFGLTLFAPEINENLLFFLLCPQGINLK